MGISDRKRNIEVPVSINLDLNQEPKPNQFLIDNNIKGGSFVGRKKSGNVFAGSKLNVDGQGIYNEKNITPDLFKKFPKQTPVSEGNPPTPTPTPSTTPLACDFTYVVGSITNTPTQTPTKTPSPTPTSPISTFCVDIGSEAIPPTSTKMDIIGYYNGYPWFSGLWTFDIFSYYMIVYYDTIQEAWIGAQSPTPITPPGDVNTITTINTDVGIGLMPPETGWGIQAGAPYGGATLVILGINYNDNSCLVTPTPTNTPTVTPTIPCNVTLISTTYVSGTTWNYNFTTAGSCGTLSLEYSSDNITWFSAGAGGCTSPRPGETGISGGTIYFRISLICFGATAVSNVITYVFPSPTPTPTNTPTPTEPPRYRFLPNNRYFPDYSAYLNNFIDNSTSAYFYGYFSGYSVNDVVVPTGRIIKLNQDLTIDYSFTGGTGFVSPFPLAYQNESILKQPDGKIIVTGYFTSYSGVSKNKIVRLNVDGSIDNTFNIGSGFVGGAITPYTTVVDIDSSGNIIVPGAFTTYNGVSVPMSYLAKLSSGGTMDMTFSATTGFADVGTIPQRVLVNTDDSMYVTGYFGSFSGISANRIIKLQSNGYKDYSFDYGTGFNSTSLNAIYTFRISGETSFYVVGNNYTDFGYSGFTTYNGTPVNRILKLMSNGTIDPSFNSGTGFSGGTGNLANGLSVNCRIIWSNKLLINGAFTSYNGTPSINWIILNSDGTVLQSFTTDYIIMFTIGNKLYGQTATGYLTLLMTYP